MSYATVQDLIGRYGEAQLVRYTTPEDQPQDTIAQVRVQLALDDASDTIDSFLRRRDAVPVTTPTPALSRACCLMAIADLASSGQSIPTEQQIADRDGQLAWLKQLSTGVATLDGAVTPTTGTEFARVSDRAPPIDRGGRW